MPCMCWYDPPEESKKLIKSLCKQLADEAKRLRQEGDPRGCEIQDIHALIDHLYDPSKCKESKQTDQGGFMTKFKTTQIDLLPELFEIVMQEIRNDRITSPEFAFAKQMIIKILNYIERSNQEKNS